MLNKRTNILLSEELWQDILSLARSSNTSAADLIRKAVKSTYFSKDQTAKKLQAFESILSVRTKSKNIDYKSLINYGRK